MPKASSRRSTLEARERGTVEVNEAWLSLFGTPGMGEVDCYICPVGSETKSNLEPGRQRTAAMGGGGNSFIIRNKSLSRQRR
jgi:hypothetical protein